MILMIKILSDVNECCEDAIGENQGDFEIK